MREILESCVALSRTAFETYRGMAAVCAARRDEELADAFTYMAEEKRLHVDWWSDLLVAWESGLVPDIAEEADLGARLTELAEEVHSAIPELFEQLTPDEMLTLAAQVEFFMLDPVLGELTDLMRPGGRPEMSRTHSVYIMRLIDAIESRYAAESLARFLARVLRRAYRDQQRLAALAVRDPLTGLYNRRGLLSHLRQWLSWSARYDRPLGVALIDVDGFKAINDRYGHATGDAALQAISTVISDVVRSSDLVGRFGGDEFVVLAPETGEADLIALLTRIVDAVRATRLDAQPDLALSVSSGGAWAPGGVDIALEEFIAAADASLYAAKSAGRNRAGVPHAVGAEPVA